MNGWAGCWNESEKDREGRENDMRDDDYEPLVIFFEFFFWFCMVVGKGERKGGK